MLGLKANNSQLDAVYTRVGELSAENGAKVLNFVPVLSEYDSRELRVGITDAHPNERGHRLYADLIYDFLITEHGVIGKEKD